MTAGGAAPQPQASPPAPAQRPGAGAFFAAVAKLSSAVAATALAVMVLAIVVDVAMANLFKQPISGTFDLVETTLVILVFMGFPATFLRNGHIAVDVIDHFVSPAAVARLKWVAAAVSMFFLLFFAWQMASPALDAFKFGERKQELGLPLWVLWIPMILGFVLSAVALVAVLVPALTPPKED
jgi:TRAP-type C4-dicarboxylate transport system permease small subunit